MANEKNNVFVELYDLTLTDRTDDRFGRVVTSKSLTEDDLIKIAVTRRTDLYPPHQPNHTGRTPNIGNGNFNQRPIENHVCHSGGFTGRRLQIADNYAIYYRHQYPQRTAYLFVGLYT